MPLTGRLTERVSYGNKYKHISTINRNIARPIERHVEPVACTLVFRFEGYFAGGRQRRFGRLDELGVARG